ncbi:hypothetical protein GGR54DRAFT_636395 [Hypoxylon sp. NC1633]|nr:hypothetical protein GGR54DRAFT_636395 [Hypoxylon sp. NC1633]
MASQEGNQSAEKPKVEGLISRQVGELPKSKKRVSWATPPTDAGIIREKIAVRKVQRDDQFRQQQEQERKKPTRGEPMSSDWSADSFRHMSEGPEPRFGGHRDNPRANSKPLKMDKCLDMAFVKQGSFFYMSKDYVEEEDDWSDKEQLDPRRTLYAVEVQAFLQLGIQKPEAIMDLAAEERLFERPLETQDERAYEEGRETGEYAGYDFHGKKPVERRLTQQEDLLLADHVVDEPAVAGFGRRGGHLEGSSASYFSIR